MAKNINRISNAQNNAVQAIVGFIDSLNNGTFYTLFSNPILQQIFIECARYITAPVTILTTIFMAILAWRQAYIDKGKKSSVLSASIETITALAVVTGVLGSLIAASTFALVTPIIIVAVIATKTLYNIGAAIYYGVQSSTYTNPLASPKKIEKKKQENFELAKKHTVGAVIGLAALATTVGVFLLGHMVLAGIGVGVAVLCAGLAIVKGYHAFKELHAKKSTDNTENKLKKPTETSQLTIANRLHIDLKNKKSSSNILSKNKLIKSKKILPMISYANHVPSAPTKSKRFTR